MGEIYGALCCPRSRVQKKRTDGANHSCLSCILTSYRLPGRSADRPPPAHRLNRRPTLSQCLGFSPYWLLMLLVTPAHRRTARKKVTTALSHALVRAGIVGSCLFWVPSSSICPTSLLRKARPVESCPTCSTRRGYHSSCNVRSLSARGCRIVDHQLARAATFGSCACCRGGPRRRYAGHLPDHHRPADGVRCGGTPAIAGQASEFLANIAERRLGQPWTFLLLGGLASLTLGLLWQRFADPGKASRTTTFVLCLVAIGSLLTFMPEFAYLRDNFGYRMNTVFKFYYQSWLLLGSPQHTRLHGTSVWPRGRFRAGGTGQAKCR